MRRFSCGKVPDFFESSVTGVINMISRCEATPLRDSRHYEEDSSLLLLPTLDTFKTRPENSVINLSAT
jgi:hypothetical protein